MGKNRQLIIVASLSLCFFIVTACSRGNSVEAAHDNRPSVSPAGQDFMMKAAEADLSGIDAAKLALQQSANDDVRNFARMIQSDHTNALDDLSDLMKDKNVSEPTSASADARQDLNRMSELTGSEFDREFVNMMVADHEKAIDMFRDQIGIAQDPDIKKYAGDQLPKLQMHLEKAQRLQSQLFRRSAE